jgi:hypothetical protein
MLLAVDLLLDSTLFNVINNQYIQNTVEKIKFIITYSIDRSLDFLWLIFFRSIFGYVVTLVN